MAVGIHIDGQVFQSLDLDETEEDIAANPGVVYGGTVANVSTTDYFLKFWNTNTVTVGTTSSYMTIPVPAGTVVSIPGGWRFSTALTAAVVNGMADSASSGPSANEVSLTLIYKSASNG